MSICHGRRVFPNGQPSHEGRPAAPQVVPFWCFGLGPGAGSESCYTEALNDSRKSSSLRDCVSSSVRGQQQLSAILFCLPWEPGRHCHSSEPPQRCEALSTSLLPKNPALEHEPPRSQIPNEQNCKSQGFLHSVKMPRIAEKSKLL